jgi:type I restriction-modification system DNA methylase subunit
MPAPPEILELVQRFRDNYDQYKHPSYNETQLRREFVDPLFKALGWDVDNTQGAAEAYKPVIHEDSIKVGGATKAPDYSFRFGGIRKFFVETKKPAVNIKLDADPAFQLRRYAWSAKLPLSILTDFEEFAVYDCRIKPNHTDKASVGRILYITFEQYEEKWDEIAGLFTEEAIRKGAFDRYAESNKKKRGTAEVDDAFLKEIEEWRYTLARTLARQNPHLSQRALNFAVQKTIDRIIFLRICEDRGIEKYGTLQATTNGRGIYPRLCDLFRSADDRYNSGLFHFTNEKGRPEEPDEWTLELAIDDKVLKDIVRDLYYPDSPYEFSVISADILGQVYEQFLGKVIRLTAGHQAKVEDKPEVKKAGGVYYTPKYIVDYIVANTVGKLVEDKQPHEVAGRTKTGWKPAKGKLPLSVLDPACGSGSFLIGAYQYLLDWYRDQYVADKPEKLTDRIYRVGDQWRLTTDERQRILLDHIFGVDIDTQAVEVTKLSLLLKVLEGENKENLERRRLLFRKQALPDLSNNIKCGNSLIGPDFYDNQQLDLFDEDERLRINVFDWSAEFKEIMRGGGFDAVIGNPPYILLQTLNQPLVFDYLSVHYSTAVYKIDTYIVFLEAAQALTSDGGKYGMITPSSYLRNKHARPLRELILHEDQVDRIAIFDYSVFKSASVDTCILVATRSWSDTTDSHASIEWFESQDARLMSRRVDTRVWQGTPSLEFNVVDTEDDLKVIEAIEASTHKLGDIATAYFGIQTFDRKKYVGDLRLGASWKPAIDGVNINRYRLALPSEYVNVAQGSIKSGGNLSVYEKERIGIRQIGRTPVCTLVPQGWYSLNTIYNVFFTKSTKWTLRALLGVLSSQLIRYYWERRYFDQKRTFPKIKKAHILGVPIPVSEAKWKTVDKIDQRVSEILELHRSAAESRTPQEKTALQRQIDATVRQIDQLVYQLYGLTDDEIRIVEEATQ